MYHILPLKTSGVQYHAFNIWCILTVYNRIKEYMRFLLINPPTYFYNKKGKRRPDTFPLGILYVASALINKGYQVDFLDILAEDLSPQDVRHRIEELRDRNYDMVGITGMSVQYIYIKYLSKQVRDVFGNVPIVTGGACPTYSHTVLLKNTDVDIAVIGEGENTIVDIAEHGTFKDVRGICFKDDDSIELTPPREPVMELDNIAFPAYELLDFKLYGQSMCYEHEFPDTGRRETLKWVSICSGRGCPYSCNFCSKTFKGVRLRSVDNIKEEILYLKRFIEFNYVVFTDELPLINEKRSMSIAEMMASLGLYWSASARINILNRSLLEELKRCGCVSLSIGIESGSQRLLDSMNKKIRIEETRQVLFDMISVGIVPSTQLVFGYPGEDDDSIEETYNLFKDLPITNAGFYVITPLPGSKLYREAIEQGIIEDEDKYLSGLETGTSEVHANFTNWTDQELIEKKELLEKRLYYNGLKARFGKEYLIKNVGIETLENMIGKANTQKLLS